jgi:hypothetical protein
MNRYLPIKHWLRTLLLGPLFILAFIIISEHHKGDIAAMLILYPLFFLYGAVISLPALVLHYIVFLVLVRFGASELGLKIGLSVTAVISIVATFSLLGGTLMLPISAAYSLAAIITGALLKMEKQDSPENTEDTIFR